MTENEPERIRMSPHSQENQFLEEVFGLFVLEAQEWISQCTASLLELEGTPSADRQAKIYETIICGVTNLGGSAATIELPALEKLAFALLPLLHTMRERESRASDEQLAALREGLSTIMFAVEHLEETKIGTVACLDGVLQRVVDPPLSTLSPSTKTDLPSPLSTPEAEPARPIRSSTALIEALHDFERVHSGSMEQSRHVVEAVIRQVNGGQGDQNGSHVDASNILQVLQEMDALDEEFLIALRLKLPIIGAFLSTLQSGRSSMLTDDSEMGMIILDLQMLQDAARTLDAKPIVMFFHGLQTFLALLSRTEVTVLPERFEAVASRVQSILPLAQQWVEIGRQERASIQKVVHS